MSKIINIAELMQICGIDGVDNEQRVAIWQKALESDIVGFTGLDVENCSFSDDELQYFISFAKLYLQESIKTLYFAPNYYNEVGIQLLQTRLKQFAQNLINPDGNNG